MTEYDYSEEAYAAFREKQRGVSRWVERTQAHAEEFRNPFMPGTPMPGHAIPSPPTSIPSSPPPRHHSRTPPRRSESMPVPRGMDAAARSRPPQRARTMYPAQSQPQPPPMAVYPHMYPGPAPRQSSPHSHSHSHHHHHHHRQRSESPPPPPRTTYGPPPAPGPMPYRQQFVSAAPAQPTWYVPAERVARGTGVDRDRSSHRSGSGKRLKGVSYIGQPVVANEMQSRSYSPPRNGRPALLRRLFPFSRGTRHTL